MCGFFRIRGQIVNAHEVVAVHVDVQVYRRGRSINRSSRVKLLKLARRIVGSPVDRRGLLVAVFRPGDGINGEAVHFELGLDGLHLFFACEDGDLSVGLIRRVGNVHDSILSDMGDRHAVGIDCIHVQAGKGCLVDHHLHGHRAGRLHFRSGGGAHEADVKGHHAVVGLAFGCQSGLRVLVRVGCGIQRLHHQLDVLVKGIRGGNDRNSDLFHSLGIDHLGSGLFRLLCLGLFRLFCLSLLRLFCLGLLRLFCLSLLRLFRLGLLRLLGLGIFGLFRLGILGRFRLGILSLRSLFCFICCGLCFLRFRLDSLCGCVIARHGLGRSRCFRGLCCLLFLFRQHRSLCLLLFGRIQIIRYAGRRDIVQRLRDRLCDLFQRGLQLRGSFHCHSCDLILCAIDRRGLGIGPDDHAQCQQNA